MNQGLLLRFFKHVLPSMPAFPFSSLSVISGRALLLRHSRREKKAAPAQEDGV